MTGSEQTALLKTHKSPDCASTISLARGTPTVPVRFLGFSSRFHTVWLKNPPRPATRRGPSTPERWLPERVNSTTSTELGPVADLLLSQAGDLRDPIAVLDDVDGELTGALIQRGHSPAVWCDDVRAEQSVPEHVRHGTPQTALTGARTVLWHLPRAVSAVEEYGELIARYAAQDVRVIAAARIKQLSRSMNTALLRSFGTVTASLGHRKARALVASVPLAGRPTWPRRSHLTPLGLDVVAHGATFSTNRLDRGTALLIDCLDQLPSVGTAIDLGCGSGILATVLARRGLQVDACDVAWSAVDATRLTTQANGVVVDIHRSDGLEAWNSRPVDLIVSNPPFHVGSAKDTTPTRRLFTQAGRALRDGGELWCVYNAHLPYLPWLRRAVGPTRIVVRNRSFLVTKSVRESRRSA